MARKPRKGASKAFLKALNDMPLINRYEINDLVTHVNHGNGKVVALGDTPSSVIVQFDHEVKDWGTDILEVSTACLKKR
jgi:hypothetical protein